MGINNIGSSRHRIHSFNTFGGWQGAALDVIAKLGRQLARQLGKEEEEAVCAADQGQCGNAGKPNSHSATSHHRWRPWWRRWFVISATLIHDNIFVAFYLSNTHSSISSKMYLIKMDNRDTSHISLVFSEKRWFMRHNTKWLHIRHALSPEWLIRERGEGKGMNTRLPRHFAGDGREKMNASTLFCLVSDIYQEGRKEPPSPCLRLALTSLVWLNSFLWSAECIAALHWPVVFNNKSTPFLEYPQLPQEKGTWK